jgi:hypothetical protein
MIGHFAAPTLASRAEAATLEEERAANLAQRVAQRRFFGPIVGDSRREFTIDATGAKPRKYRLSAVLTPYGMVFRPRPRRPGARVFVMDAGLLRGVLGGAGMPYPAHSHLQVGIEDGRYLVVHEQVRDPGQPELAVVGDASDLDNILVDEGVSIRGKSKDVPDMRKYTLLVTNRNVRPFHGDLLTFPLIVRRLIAHAISGGRTETGSNFEVLLSHIRLHFPGEAAAGVESENQILDELKEAYLEPMKQAALDASPEVREILARINEEAVEGIDESLTPGKSLDPYDHHATGALEHCRLPVRELQQILEEP